MFNKLNSNSILNDGKHFFKETYKKGFFHLLTGNFMLIIVGFLGYLIIAFFLSADDIGRIKTMQTYASIIVIIATLGLNVSTLKLCSDTKFKENREKLFLSALKYVFSFSIIVYLIAVLLAQLNFFSKDKLVNNFAVIFFIAIIPSSVNLVIVSYYQAVKKFKSLSKIQVTTKLAGIILLIILTYLLGVLGYSIGYIFTFFITSVFLIIPLLKQIKISKQNYFTEHWQLAKYSLLANLFSRLNISIDIILINFVLSAPFLLGQYAFALNFIFFLDIVPKTIQQISIPYFSEKSNDYISWQNVFNKYNKILIIVLLLITVLSILFIPIFIHFVFSGKYDISIKFFLIIILGWFFRSMAYLKSGAIIGFGEIKYNFYTALFILPLNILIIYSLLKQYDIFGVAYGSLIVGILTFLIVNLFFKKVVAKHKTYNRVS